MECDPNCREDDPLCHANREYVDCKVCGDFIEKPCRFSPWCWVPTWEPPSDVGEFQNKFINLKNWVDNNTYYNKGSIIPEKNIFETLLTRF